MHCLFDLHQGIKFLPPLSLYNDNVSDLDVSGCMAYVSGGSSIVVVRNLLNLFLRLGVQRPPYSAECMDDVSACNLDRLDFRGTRHKGGKVFENPLHLVQ